MTELKLTLLPNGQVACEMEGSDAEICKMICTSMIGSRQFASIILGAIPTFLDERKVDRAGYCETIMKAQGGKQ